MSAPVASLHDPILDAAEIRLLAEVGFLAAGLHHLQAPRIFEALRLLRPDLSAPLIGLAMHCIESGKAQEAVTILKAGIANGLGERADLQAFLGIALIAAKQTLEAERLLKRLLSRVEANAPEMRIAQGLLKQHVVSRAVHAGLPAQQLASASSIKST
jgi:hypothetical protein